MNKNDTLPDKSGRAGSSLFIGVILLAAALLTVLVAAGFWDPVPSGAGRPIWPTSRRVPVAAGTETVQWDEERVVMTPDGGDLTLRLRAAWLSGETDVAYGLVLGLPDEFLAIAVSPLGYVTVWSEGMPVADGVRPWQPWPHIRRGAATNEWQLSRRDGVWTIRLNREYVTAIRYPGVAVHVGTYTRSFGDAAVVEYQELLLFSEPAD